MPELFAYLDESGNYDFTPKGTKFWVLTSVITTDPRVGEQAMWDLKHKIIRSGADLDLGRFHATEDRQVDRDRVLDIIAGMSNIRIDSVVVRKQKAAPKIQPLEKFYPMMVENLLKYPLDPRGLGVANFDRVLVFMDRSSAPRKERELVTKAVKQSLLKHLSGVPHSVCMHESASNHLLQVADYASWSTFVKWERGEQRPFSKIAKHVRSEFDIFKGGTIDWY